MRVGQMRYKITVDVLRGQPIKHIQVVSNLEFHEYRILYYSSPKIKVLEILGHQNTHVLMRNSSFWF